jgi:hypothetical protein
MYACFRRLKRWIFEKQQKGAQGVRRHRHRSVGDAEPNLPRNKRQQQLQQQFTQAIQVGERHVLVQYSLGAVRAVPELWREDVRECTCRSLH